MTYRSSSRCKITRRTLDRQIIHRRALKPSWTVQARRLSADTIRSGTALRHDTQLVWAFISRGARGTWLKRIRYQLIFIISTPVNIIVVATLPRAYINRNCPQSYIGQQGIQLWLIKCRSPDKIECCFSKTTDFDLMKDLQNYIVNRSSRPKCTSRYWPTISLLVYYAYIF